MLVQMKYQEILLKGSQILKSNNIKSSSLDCELILSKVLNKTREEVLTNLNNKELEELVKKIVRSELKNLQFLEKSPKPKSEKAKTFDKRKSGTSMDLLTKTELLSLSKKNNLGLNSKNTKAEIIKELKENKVGAH